MAQLVDLHADPGRAAVALPAVVGCIVGQRPARPVDAGAEQRPGGVAGAGQVQPEQRDVAAVVQQHRPHGAALAVDAHVLVVRAQVQVLDVEPACLGGPLVTLANCTLIARRSSADLGLPVSAPPDHRRLDPEWETRRLIAKLEARSRRPPGHPPASRLTTSRSRPQVGITGRGPLTAQLRSIHISAVHGVAAFGVREPLKLQAAGTRCRR